MFGIWAEAGTQEPPAHTAGVPAAVMGHTQF